MLASSSSGAPTTPSASPIDPAKALKWPGLLAALLFLAYFGAQIFVLSGRIGFPLDDGWIHLQFARQLALGDGLSYNPGVPMPGSTAPLWTALLSVLFLLPGNPVFWTLTSGLVLLLTTLRSTASLAGELDLGRTLTTLAVLQVALCHWLLWSALSGMEILLFASLSLFGIRLHLQEMRGGPGPSRSLPVLALATLARPEGYLLLGLAVLARLTRLRKSGAAAWTRLAEGLGMVALVTAPVLLYYWIVGGSPLPTTFGVKGSSPHDLLPSSRYLRTVTDIFFRSQPVLLLLAGAGFLRLLGQSPEGKGRGAWLLGLWPLALAMAYALLDPQEGAVAVGNFGRYFFPLLPVIVLLGLLGAQPFLQTLRNRWLKLALLALLLGPQIAGISLGLPHYVRTVTNVEDSDVAAARWLGQHLPPEALIAVQDIGAIKYHLPNPVLDLVGIVEPPILPVLRGTGPADPTYWEQRLLGYLETRRPDVLVVFTRSYPMLSRPQPGFERLATFRVENNAAMAGDELIVLSTPWTRFPIAAQTPAGP